MLLVGEEIANPQRAILLAATLASSGSPNPQLLRRRPGRIAVVQEPETEDVETFESFIETQLKTKPIYTRRNIRQFNRWDEFYVVVLFAALGVLFFSPLEFNNKIYLTCFSLVGFFVIFAPIRSTALATNSKEFVKQLLSTELSNDVAFNDHATVVVEARSGTMLLRNTLIMFALVWVAVILASIFQNPLWVIVGLVYTATIVVKYARIERFQLQNRSQVVAVVEDKVIVWDTSEPSSVTFRLAILKSRALDGSTVTFRTTTGSHVVEFSNEKTAAVFLEQSEHFFAS